LWHNELGKGLEIDWSKRSLKMTGAMAYFLAHSNSADAGNLAGVLMRKFLKMAWREKIPSWRNEIASHGWSRSLLPQLWLLFFQFEKIY